MQATEIVNDQTLALSEIHHTELLGHSLSETSAKAWLNRTLPIGINFTSFSKIKKPLKAELSALLEISAPILFVRKFDQTEFLVDL